MTEPAKPLSEEEMKFWRSNSHGQSQLMRRFIATIDALTAERDRYQEALERIGYLYPLNEITSIADAALNPPKELT